MSRLNLSMIEIFIVPWKSIPLKSTRFYCAVFDICVVMDMLLKLYYEKLPLIILNNKLNYNAKLSA